MKNVRDFRKIIKVLDFLGCLCYNRRVAVWKPSRRVLGKVLLEGRVDNMQRMLVNWSPIKETMQLVGKPYVKTDCGVYPVAFKEETITARVKNLFFSGNEFIAETADGKYLLRGDNNPPFIEGQDLMRQIFNV